MNKLDKGTPRPRFGSDWDLDLGWVLLWLIIFAFLFGVVTRLTWASVQNNKENVVRDTYYAKNCKIVLQTQGTTAYTCQNK